MTRVVFMGTPEFSVPSLAMLVAGDYDVAGVVTQPDRPSGRGRKLEPSPVKRFAVEHDLAVLQPETLRASEAVAELAALRPDVIVVAAFGQILRPAVLALPPHGCVNVTHPAAALGVAPHRCRPQSWPATRSPEARSCSWTKVWTPGLYLARRR